MISARGAAEIKKPPAGEAETASLPAEVAAKEKRHEPPHGT